MFLDFYYALREEGIAASPASLLTLVKALDQGLVSDLDDFYVAARTTLVKTEKDFDAYDRVFLAHFGGARGLDAQKALAYKAFLEKPLADWVRGVVSGMGLSVEQVREIESMALEELTALFEERLREQQKRHEGGNRFIGTRGTSPFGNDGAPGAPGGVRVGGVSAGGAALKVAGERRYRDYAKDRPLSPIAFGEVFRLLRDLRRVGPKTELDVEETIRETLRLGGEIEPVFVRGKRDKLEVVLLIDNGGFSMDPFTDVVAKLFREARKSFKSLDIHYFHNTVYEHVYKDVRRTVALPMAELLARDAATRVILLGDASMGADELESDYGNINYWDQQTRSSRACLGDLVRRFPHCVWLNPKMKATWPHTRGSYTIREIGRIVPMFDLSLEGLGAAIDRLRVAGSAGRRAAVG